MCVVCSSAFYEIRAAAAHAHWISMLGFNRDVISGQKFRASLRCRAKNE